MKSITILVIVFAAAICGCSTRPMLSSSQQLTPFDRQAEQAALGYYILPKGLVPLSVTFPACTADESKQGGPGCPLPTLTVASTKFVADQSHIYALDATLSQYSADSLTFEVDSDGLLKSIEANAKDETGAVIAKIVELGRVAASTLSGFDPSFAELRFSKQEPKKDDGKKTTVTFPEVVVSGVLDLSASRAQEIDEFQRQLTDPAKRYGVDTTVKLSVSRPYDPQLFGTSRANSGCGTGLCYRPNMPYLLALKLEAASIAVRTLAPHIVSLPNDSPLLAIGLDRTAFVERKGKLTFVNGALTKTEISKPSEALAVANVPIDVLKSIAAIPTDLLTLRIKQSTDATSLAEAQAKLLDAQAKLKKAIEDARK